ncbi:1-aminocyclopropane-1-carboxylate deaminase/D-cysteine desulfhydrase [Flavobacterium luteum]|uniref:1-aminocyclopropane-1-carboxylate deaminase/D-cysteine desulfhydrase n=1 Tax=Flavobacterium luteum TaxID=2026654 RepID=A0A7J5AGT4_9FLAO|nr:pyridoxal-phosphate dependent enzyme [Flavobacterium luteum]KAB1156598.1 1-aminocyclopropane-1-carboxylate deaminase/D-cysteine desulfhydrase [Flavobacterium luteum]
MQSINQKIEFPFSSNCTVYIKREDLIHPIVSGNKFRKLKYNILQAKGENQTKLLTFGGAFSNHIAAVAYAAKKNGFQSIGIIRGDELEYKVNENPTLSFARNCGMQFEFVSREIYRKKSEPDFIENLKEKHGDFYLIPEGGTNELAIKGCQEILNEDDNAFDYICCSVGTGGTISGIINSTSEHQKVLGFPALKSDFLKDEICKFAKNNRWDLISDYHFEGYGKINDELVAFINTFYKQTKIPLDSIYTGKMLYGVFDLIKKGFFPVNSNILVIHTGGIQGNQGMNIKLKNKNLPLIQYHD